MGASKDRKTKSNHASGSGLGNQTGQNVAAINGGHQGSGHTSMLNPASSECGFLGLRHQKGVAEEHTARQVADAGGVLDERVKSGALDETCETEDHSFMGHKPGPDTMMGSSTLKGAIDRLTK